jgi:hypothetical protein
VLSFKACDLSIASEAAYQQSKRCHRRCKYVPLTAGYRILHHIIIPWLRKLHMLCIKCARITIYNYFLWVASLASTLEFFFINALTKPNIILQPLLNLLPVSNHLLILLLNLFLCSTIYQVVQHISCMKFTKLGCSMVEQLQIPWLICARTLHSHLLHELIKKS